MPTKSPRKPSKLAQLLRMAQRPLRARDVAAAGIPRSYLQRLVDRELIRKVDRGLYLAVDADVTELHSLAEVAARAPKAVMCLLTALRVHNLTTENPHRVWVLIGRQARAPKMEYPALEVFRASGAALTFGVETRNVEGVTVRITTPAKTVADCFKYRGRAGTDVAVEALRDFIRQARARRGRDGFTIEALTNAARVDRVENVMRPYIEALL